MVVPEEEHGHDMPICFITKNPISIDSPLSNDDLPPANIHNFNTLNC